MSRGAGGEDHRPGQGHRQQEGHEDQEQRAEFRQENLAERYGQPRQRQAIPQAGKQRLPCKGREK